jgi:hypothetical protein
MADYPQPGSNLIDVNAQGVDRTELSASSSDYHAAIDRGDMAAAKEAFLARTKNQSTKDRAAGEAFDRQTMNRISRTFRPNTAYSTGPSE